MRLSCFAVHDVHREARRGHRGQRRADQRRAAVLVVLLLTEGVTIIDMGGLRTPHMVVGLVLIPPVLVKLGSTGYRFARYYLARAGLPREGAAAHAAARCSRRRSSSRRSASSPPGVALLALGHRSDTLLEVHKVTFIVWGVVFGVHVLAHLRGMARSLRSDWSVPGSAHAPRAPRRLDRVRPHGRARRAALDQPLARRPPPPRLTCVVLWPSCGQRSARAFAGRGAWFGHRGKVVRRLAAERKSARAGYTPRSAMPSHVQRPRKSYRYATRIRPHNERAAQLTDLPK